MLYLVIPWSSLYWTSYPNQRENNVLFLISVRDIDSPETVNKFKKYEADYFRMLMGKYFSKKDPYGGKQILWAWFIQ